MISALEMILAMILGTQLYTAHYMILNSLAIKYGSYELKMKWNIVSIFLTAILGLGMWIWDIQFWAIFLVFGAGIALIFDMYVLDPYTKRRISTSQAEEVIEQVESQVQEALEEEE